MIVILFKTKKLHLDHGEKFRNKVMENYLKENNNNNNIDRIIEGSYNLQHQGAVEAFNKTFKIFDISKGSSREKLLVDSINDFLVYYNDRRHNTSEMRPFKLMTRWMIKIAQKSKGKYNKIKIKLK